MGIIDDQLKQSTLGLGGTTPDRVPGNSIPSQITSLGSVDSEAKSDLSLKGETPDLRAGASNTSQLHAYGNTEEEAADFQNANVFPKQVQDLTNLKFKLKGDKSEYDLNGKTPEKYTNPETGIAIN